MTTDEIIEVAKANGLAHYLYGPGVLTECNDGSVRFLQSDQLSITGTKLIKFAQAIAKRSQV